jgi:glycosyltransferase involved in cell wall biosynthesis
MPDNEQTPEELLTVIVPCFNEETSIGPTVREILEVAKGFPLRVEVLLCDDGSTDGTVASMKKLCEEFEQCRMRANDRNLGVGRTVRECYQEIDPDSWVTCFPGDNEMVFQSLENHLAVRHDHDVVLGYLQNPVIRPVGRRLASSAFTLTARFLYGFSYRYLNGVKLYRCWVFRDLEVISSGHAINAEMLAKAQLRHPGLRIVEAPFVARGRASGRSKAMNPKSVLKAVKDTVAGFKSVRKYRRSAVQERGHWDGEDE